MTSPNTILIVEDEAIVAADLAAKLTRLGYAVAGTAASGEAAVRLAEQLRPDLVLMDIRLDGPSDGIEAAHAIRRRLDVPIIYLTAHSDTATLERATLTGPFGYILKPFDDRELETQIALGLYKHNAERQLRAQHEWLRVILSSIGDGVIAADDQGRVAFINPVAERLTAWDKEEAIGKPVKEVFRIVDTHGRTIMADPVAQVLQTGRAFGPSEHALLLRRDGTRVPLGDSGAPIRDDEGRTLGVVLVFRDIRERQQAETEHEKLLSAIEQVGEIVLITDPRGTIEYVNPAFERVTGYSRAQVIGQNPRILKSGRQNDAFYRHLWQTISQGQTFQGRMVDKRKDGTLYTNEVTISPVRDAAGQIVNYVSVTRDVTAQTMLEEQLHQARKMESVGRLAGGVAHDFNNKLSVILGNTELALAALGAEHPVRGFLTEIREAAQLSADLTYQLLAFARKQMIMPQVLDLNLTLEGMLKMLRRLIGEDIQLTWRPGGNLGPIYMDPSQLDQVVINLCTNARDAIAGVGKVHIETRNATTDRDPACRNAGKVADHYVALVIADNGSGMSPETKAHLFEPFFTTKELNKGTGLGLATVYGIVQQNHGFIDVRSAPGEGTTFTIYLPRHAAPVVSAVSPAPETPTPGGSETLLLVEDEPALLNLGKLMLERLGYRVMAAGTPEAALHLAEAHRGRIDLLITDVIMPGMNGRELSRRVRSMHPALGIVFVSGYTADIIAQHGVLDADVYFLQKPFLVRTLALKVREALDAHHA